MTRTIHRGPRWFYLRYLESLRDPANPAPDYAPPDYWSRRAKWHALQNELRDDRTAQEALGQQETARDGTPRPPK